MNWIKVSDRMPEPDKEVLTLSESGVFRISARWKMPHREFWSNVGADSCGCCDTYDENITHWMELPELPVEEEARISECCNVSGLQIKDKFGRPLPGWICPGCGNLYGASL